jgi:hypothetical protein
MNRVLLKNSRAAWLPGLAVSLKGVFYPRFKRPRTKKGNSSTKTGIYVHRQVEHIVKGIPLKKRRHKFTVQVFDKLKEMGLVPTASEVNVLSLKGGFLTKSDLICRYANKDALVVVSLKTGYNQAYSRAQNKCKWIQQPNCYKTHHQLQLALEVACIELEYGLKVDDAFVLYVGFGAKKSTKVVPLESWAKTNFMKEKLMTCMLHDAKKNNVRVPTRETLAFSE